MNLSADRSVNSLPCHRLVELICCGLLNTLGGYKETPNWLKTFSFATGVYGSGPFGDKNIAGNIHFAPVSYVDACLYHIQYLFLSGQYARTLAAADMLLRILSENNKALILELYYNMITACCYKELGEHEKVLPLVKHAVELALPDGLYLLLADFDGELDGIVERFIKKYDKNAQGSVRRINNHFISGIKILKKEYMEDELPYSLTKREQEVARLAIQGMRNIDIAEALCISPNTVKAHLKSVFEKLGIDKRSKLREKLK